MVRYENLAMRRIPRLHRIVSVLACGGCLLQFTGCLAAAAPGLASFLESTALSAVFHGLLSL